MSEKPKWIRHREYEPHTNFDYLVITGEMGGKLFRVSQMAPDAWKLEINSKPVIYNASRNELLTKFPDLRRAMKEIKGGFAASQKKKKFEL